MELTAISCLSAFSQKQSTSMHLNEWGFIKTVLKSDNSINATFGKSNAGVNSTFNNQYSFNKTPYVPSIVAAENSWERHPLDNSTQVFNLWTLLASSNVPLFMPAIKYRLLLLLKRPRKRTNIIQRWFYCIYATSTSTYPIRSCSICSNISAFRITRTICSCSSGVRFTGFLNAVCLFVCTDHPAPNLVN